MAMSKLQENGPQTGNLPNDLKAEQALGLIGLGLMQKMVQEKGDQLNWLQADNGAPVDLLALRQRLELTSLAIQTGAPLSTAEVSKLLGARPGSAIVERGGLVAKRVSRNVWKLSSSTEVNDNNQDGFKSDHFRRRL